ncbi:MAG: hypothetical protein ACLUSK_13835 [Bacteroides stercoris]
MCSYVGDSGVDMQTAIHAEVTSCGVTWDSARVPNWKLSTRIIL